MSKVEVINFGNKRTPKQTVIDALNKMDDEQIAIVVFLSKDDYVNTAWSDGSQLKRIGMLEFAKNAMMNASFEEDNE